MQNQLQTRLMEVIKKGERGSLPTPAEEDFVKLEEKLGMKFSEDFKLFLRTSTEILLPPLEPAVVFEKGGYRYLPNIAQDAWECGVKSELLAFCMDNGDYFCLADDGSIVFWDHNGTNNEKWKDLADWVENVWLKYADF